MKTVDGEIKLSFMDILLSPVMSLRNMVTSQKDIEDDGDLNLDSSNETEAYLAEHQAKINEKVEAYGGSGKAKGREEILSSVKVEANQLNKAPTQEQKEADEKAVDKNKDADKGERVE